MIIMKRLACPPDDLWLLRLPTAPTTMRNLVRAHTLIGKIEGLEPISKIEVLASLNKTEEQFQATVAQVRAKLRAQGMSAILETPVPIYQEDISRGINSETASDVLNKNVTIYQDALARLGPETPLIRAERLRVSGLRPSASSSQNFSDTDMQSQMEAFLRRRESERPARSWFSRMGSRIGSFLSRCVSFCRRTPVTDPISLRATALIRESTEAFRAGFGEKNTLILTEMLKRMDINAQISTLNSEYAANPKKREAAKAALTELVHYHSEQGTGQQFTSAAIIGQIKTEQAVPARDTSDTSDTRNKGVFLRKDSVGSLAFSTFANAVGRDCLRPIKEKMDAIGNAEPMEIDPDLEATLQRNQEALIAATTEVFAIVASLDSRMPDSLKAVLRDVITAAGDEGKTAFNATFFLGWVNPIIAPTDNEDKSQNKEAKTTIASVIQKTGSAWSCGAKKVDSLTTDQKFLEPLASLMIDAIDALFKRIAPFATAAMTNSSDAALGDLQDSWANSTSLVLSTPRSIRSHVGGGSASRHSDDTNAYSEKGRNGFDSLVQSVPGNFWDLRPESDASDLAFSPWTSKLTPTNLDPFADGGQASAGSLLLFDLSRHRAHVVGGVPASAQYHRESAGNAPLTLFRSGMVGSVSATRNEFGPRLGLEFESTYLGSGMLSEGSSTQRSLAYVFDQAAPASEQPAPGLRTTLPLVLVHGAHVGGGGSVARPSDRTAASDRGFSRYNGSAASTPPKTPPRDSARVSRTVEMAQTRPLSPGYTAASQAVQDCTHRYWADSRLPEKLQAVLADLSDMSAKERKLLQVDIEKSLTTSKKADSRLPEKLQALVDALPDMSAKERKLLQADIEKSLTTSKKAEKKIASLVAQEKPPSQKKGAGAKKS